MRRLTQQEHQLPFHGEGVCAKCEKKAYFSVGRDALCGRHAPKPLRKPLPKNPDRKELRARAWAVHDATVKAAAERNRLAGGARGRLVCAPMTMFQGQQPEFVEGYLNVFPNFKHGDRYGGLGVPELSPKSMGPIEHGQPDLPPARNLENFHQFSKIFQGESWEDFREAQRQAFEDPVPHRHKPAAQTLPKGQNKNICRAWIWTRPETGEVVELTYVQCRQFYCNFYERCALASAAFQNLLNLLNTGTNVRLCGYDGYMPDKSLEEHYLDESRPFGHELVLYTLLAHPDDPSAWPWRKHKTEVF